MVQEMRAPTTAMFIACAGLGCAPRVAPAAVGNTAPPTEVSRVSEEELDRCACQSTAAPTAITSPEPVPSRNNQPNSVKSEETSTTTLSIALDVDGRLYLDGHELDKGSLQTALRGAYEADPAVSTILTLDGRVAHIQLVTLIRLLQQTKIGSFVIRTSNDGPWPSCRIPLDQSIQEVPGSAERPAPRVR